MKATRVEASPEIRQAGNSCTTTSKPRVNDVRGILRYLESWFGPEPSRVEQEAVHRDERCVADQVNTHSDGGGCEATRRRYTWLNCFPLLVTCCYPLSLYQSLCQGEDVA